ncbi:ATP-binding protein [Sphingomonas sp. RB3P16]|uniref:sensor histidine kinase n=1 Tax=Parasphingomonas frigoris TaxID=3096163 RepID=UPI002FCC3F76
MPIERLHFGQIRRTSTFRLTSLLGLVFALGVVALLALIYGLSARELTRRTDHILRIEATRLRASSPDTLPDRITSALAHSTSGLNYYALQSRSGEPIAGNLAIVRDFRFDHPVNIAARPGAHGPLRVLAIAVPTGETVLIGRDIAPIVDLRRRILEILIGSGVAIVVLVLGAGVLLSRAPLRRVRDLEAASRAIAAGRFDLRMPVTARGDELDLFAGTVNTMIEEVERVVAQVKGVTDAVAHDLRTPLAHVRGQLERAIALPDADPRSVAISRAALGDLDLVLERFGALLRISQLEASGRHAGFATVPLAPFLESLCELYEPLAEDAGLTLRLGPIPAATIRCDPQLLFEAISNLLDNAIKFSPAGGAVVLGATRDGEGLTLTVRDTGRGLAPHEREAALRRFYRGVDAAGIPGSGLGLSIVAAIVHLHGFSLELGDAAPGLIVRIHAPAEPPR